ncbi:MAG: MBL fold metallo-hydrolase [Calditrichaeota bacterium]|nr:MBL fold metallo-hydrolase [Calditrichota bacterium]MCB9368010.1 MBL fold metallo-hydrolase [Calditrichota bacterium]
MTKIAGYEIIPLHVGDFKLDGGAMFGVVPKPLWEKQCPADARNRIDMTARALLLKTPQRTIVVDAGIGQKDDDKFREIFDITFPHGGIVESLSQHGVSPEQVTDVIYTHLHFDHAGGTTVMKDGIAVPLFPNARHYVQSAQYHHGRSRNPRDRASYIDMNYEPVRSAGLLEFLEGDTELFPGLHLDLTSGHTPALQMIRISDGKQTMFYPSDLIPMAAHVPLPYIMGYDLFPLTTLNDKEHWLGKAAREGWLIVLEHDPKIEAMKVQFDEKGRIRIAQTGTLEELNNPDA